MDNNAMQFMVDFTLPSELTEDFVGRIPQQRSAVNRLLAEGKILHYALSLESSKLWVVFSVESEAQLMEIVQRLPLTRYMKMRVSPLTFCHTSHALQYSFSLN